MTEIAALTEEVLARRGVGGYRQYRIPALAVSPNGTLLAAYDGRPNLDDLPNPIDLLLRRSTDDGATWGPQITVRTGAGLDGYGDPSLLVDVETRRIFLFHAAGTRVGFFEAAEGIEPEDDVQHADLSFSDDDGLTWQHRRLTGMLKIGGVTGLFAAAGAGIQMHVGPFTGRLVQQFVLLHHGVIRAASAYSDDHGETWSLGAFIDGVSGSANERTNENKVVCLDDGTLLLHSRATPHRLVAISSDGGQSYSPARPHHELPDPSDNGSVARFDGLPNVSGLATPATAQWLIATHNHDRRLRRNTVLKLSPDNGGTWPFAVTICPGSSQYSTAARLPNGRIGVLYERQGYQDIVFATFDPAQLLASPASLLTHDAGVMRAGAVTMVVVLRSITPGRPAHWQSIGESVVLTQPEGDWDPTTWKEVGQGYSDETPQVLSNRASQDLNYGVVTPGFKAGDVLAFSGRIETESSASSADVIVTMIAGHAAAAGPITEPLTIDPQTTGFAASYTLTAADVAGDSFSIVFTLTAAGQVATSHFECNVATGDITES